VNNANFSMPLPSGGVYTFLCVMVIVIAIVIFFVAESKYGTGGKVVKDMFKSIIGYLLDAPFVYIKVAIGFAILRWLGWV
jgi:hypothetical protein